MSLQSVIAEGKLGCDIHVDANLFTTLLNADANGDCPFPLLLTNSPPIVGMTFFVQLLPFEFSGGTLIEVTATNGLAITPGTF